MEAKKRTLLTVAGVALLVIGVAGLVIASWNLSADIDRADRTGVSGDMFAPGVAPLGLAAICAIIVGLIMLAVIVLRRTPA